MSLSDPIADLLTRIRNALAARHEATIAKASNVCEGICKVLLDEGYIEGYKRIDDDKQGLLRIYLKYGSMGEDVITDIKRVSRPGLRIYRGVAELPRPLDGLGIAVVSTSKGVLSDRRCRLENIGGEVLCTVC